MQFYLVSLALALFVSYASVEAKSATLVKAKNDLTLISYLVQDTSPGYSTAQSAACFQKYMPLLQNLVTSLDTDYLSCETIANKEINELTAVANASRTQLTQEIGSVCKAYTKCNSSPNVLNFFDCYINESSTEANSISSLSSAASSAAIAYTTGLKAIQTKENQCTVAAENTYSTNNAETYKELNACLAGDATSPNA